MFTLLIFSLQTASVVSAVNPSIHNLQCSNKQKPWQDAMTECVSGGGRPVSFRELSDIRGKTQITEENVWASNYFSSFSFPHLSDNSSMKPVNLELCGFWLINCDGHPAETFYSLCSHIRLYLCENTTKTTNVTFNKDLRIFNGTWNESNDCKNVSKGEVYDFSCPAYYWKREIWPGKMYEFRGNQSNDGSYTTEVQHVTEKAGSSLEQKDKLGTAALVGIIVTVCIVLASIVVLVVFMRRRYGCIIKTSNKKSNADASTYQTKIQRPRSLEGHSNAAYELTSDQLNINVKAESAVYNKVRTNERIQDKLTANNDAVSSNYKFAKDTTNDIHSSTSVVESDNNDAVSLNYEFAKDTTDDIHSSTSVVESDNTYTKTQIPMYSHDDYNTTLLVRKVNKHTDSPYDKMFSGDHQANNEYDTTFKKNKMLFENDLYNKLSGTPASFTKTNIKELTQEDLDENYDSISRPTCQKGTPDNIYNTLQL